MISPRARGDVCGSVRIPDITAAGRLRRILGLRPEPQTLPALIVLAALDSVQAEFFGLLVHLPESGVAMAGLCLEFPLACELDQPVFIEAGLRERLLERG